MNSTPVSDLRRMSLMSEAQSVTRSQSETTYSGLASAFMEKRRASDVPVDATKQLVLRPLQIDSMDSGCLLHRRLSKAPNQSSMSGKEASRSYSIRSIKKYAEARHRHRGSSIPCETVPNVAKVKERTVSNRSLPLPGDETEYLRLRNFCITSKGVINRGDSFRSKSVFGVPVSGEDQGSSNVNVPSPLREDSKEDNSEQKRLRPFKVLLVGTHGVGKTALNNQFMTSEYICANGFSHDNETDRTVTVVLNSEESEMEFENETLLEENAYNPQISADAYIVVYSVTNRKSYLQAKQLLAEIEYLVDTKTIILVGNKTDLARLRTVTTEEGKSLAKDRGCKFIETSVAINHQVDELLVGILTQIRMKTKMMDKLKKKRESQATNRRSSIYTGSKASGVLKKILKRACLKSKSCDNLHVL